MQIRRCDLRATTYARADDRLDDARTNDRFDNTRGYNYVDDAFANDRFNFERVDRHDDALADAGAHCIVDGIDYARADDDNDAKAYDSLNAIADTGAEQLLSAIVLFDNSGRWHRCRRQLHYAHR